LLAVQDDEGGRHPRPCQAGRLSVWNLRA